MSGKIRTIILVVIVIAALCGLATLLVRWLEKPLPPPSSQAAHKKNEPVCLNVFVHGSFGTSLGLLSLPSVFSDQLSDTMYKKTTERMRLDDFFYQQQPILGLGLLRLEPTFDLATTGSKTLAAFPILRAFDLINEQVQQPKERQLYYTFGWSGLISQRHRRLEAIRLQNALQEELDTLRGQGILPRIRIIAHSHGANLCLNLGAIDAILKTKSFSPRHRFSAHEEEDESIKKMLRIMGSLTTKELLAKDPTQHRYDYVPLKKFLTIDEFILLGTPIQPETEQFCLSPVFKNIYNIYSDGDTIQQMDCFSTKLLTSRKRMNEAIFTRATHRSVGSNKPLVTQIKLMYEHALPDQLAQLPTAIDPVPSFWSNLFTPKPKTKDPTHKQFWFFSWREQQSEPENCLTPLPAVILVPAIIALAQRHHDQPDLDVNILPQDQFMGIFALRHNTHKLIDHLLLNQSLITNIRQQCAAWQPADTSEMGEFNRVYSYLNEPAPKSTTPPAATE